MTAPIKACLGGFCPIREKCAHHMHPANRHRPAERLCEPGLEREMFFIPINQTKECEAA